MTDEYNVARYIPKKYQNDISAIEMELDFDNGAFRTVHRYYVYYNNGESISAIGIKNIVKKIKERVKNIVKDCDNCLYADEIDGNHCYECVKGIEDKFEMRGDTDEDSN